MPFAFPAVAAPCRSCLAPDRANGPRPRCLRPPAWDGGGGVPAGADVGFAALRKGGNAVDAAVATAFAMAVTYPSAGNLGGGGFMLIYPAVASAIRSSSTTAKNPPLAAHSTMFGKNDTWYSDKAVGVPGTVAGLPWHSGWYGCPGKTWFCPPGGLAEEGFVIDSPLAGAFAQLDRRQSPESPELRRVLGKAGGVFDWAAGDRLVQKDLAQDATSHRRARSRGFLPRPCCRSASPPR